MSKFKNDLLGYKKMSEYIIKSLGNIGKYKIKNRNNISALFLAGAPGAGKTEFLNTIFKEAKKE